MAPAPPKRPTRKRPPPQDSAAAKRVRDSVHRRRDAGWRHVQVWVPTAKDARLLQRLAADLREGRPPSLPGPGADPLAGRGIEAADLTGVAEEVLERALRILRSGDARAIQRLAQRVALTEDLINSEPAGDGLSTE